MAPAPAKQNADPAPASARQQHPQNQNADPEPHHPYSLQLSGDKRIECCVLRAHEGTICQPSCHSGQPSFSSTGSLFGQKHFLSNTNGCLSWSSPLSPFETVACEAFACTARRSVRSMSVSLEVYHRDIEVLERVVLVQSRLNNHWIGLGNVRLCSAMASYASERRVPLCC